MNILLHILFALCVVMIFIGQVKEDIYLQMGAIFWLIVRFNMEEKP